MGRDRVVVYVTLHKEERVCEYGDKHNVSVYTRKFLYPTGEEYLCDNGYEKRMLPVYKDGQGRVWKKVVTIDYSNNVYYVSGKMFGMPRPAHNGVEMWQ